MPDAAFFRDLGLFVAPEFLDPSLCAKLRMELSKSQAEAGEIVHNQGDSVVDESVRKVACVQLKGPLKAQLKEQFLQLMPVLADHFKVSLGRCEGLQFLQYGAGAFYSAHRDGTESSAPELANRRVSVVLFLNRQSSEPEPDTYGGGSLVFYELFDEPGWKEIAFPLEAEAGLLVAFRSAVLHEVQPVTFGLRHTVVTWYQADGDVGPTG